MGVLAPAMMAMFVVLGMRVDHCHRKFTEGQRNSLVYRNRRGQGDDQDAFGIWSQPRQNAFISSGLPREMRTNVSMGGKWRPTRMPFFLKCSLTCCTGRPESIITKLQ